MANTVKAEVVVLGGGPGGYSAAFRAADLGKQVVLIERGTCLGGVCLNVGCIPSKALLHAAGVINEAEASAECGISFAKPKVDIAQLRSWKDGIVSKLTGGLAMLAKRRKVEVIYGVGEFIGANKIAVQGEGETVVEFERAIIAAGSEPVSLPFMPDDSRIINSTGALALEAVPKKMLIIGGGIIGLEMATVYAALGSEITIVEFMEQLIPGADLDLVKPLARSLKSKTNDIMLKTKVTAVTAKDDGLYVNFEGENAPEDKLVFDKILVAVGRKPNGKTLAAEKAGIEVDDRGFIAVDKELKTNVRNIYAIGDVIGNPMLAHKAVHEGRMVAEIIAGEKVAHKAKCIPSVAYTDPEISWVGLTENMAQEQSVNYEKGSFPWMACGRALSMGRSEGMTKLLFDPKTEKLLGAGIVGPNAGEMIAELTLAVEKGCTASDIAGTIHPHPTLSETVMMSAEAFLGTMTDLYMPKRR